MAKRIQRKRTKGWKMPENCVYVGRPTIFGNPFTHVISAKAVEAYREYLTKSRFEIQISKDGFQFAKNAHHDSLQYWFPEFVREQLSQLRGKDLACWCPLDSECHADVLLEIANR